MANALDTFRISDQDLASLTEAVTVYRTITGTNLSDVVGGLPRGSRGIRTIEEDQAARQAEFEASAAAVKALEDAQMAARERMRAIDPLTGMPYADPGAPIDPVPVTTPTLSSLDPASVPVGSPGFTLRVLGSGFDSSSVIKWDGSAAPTVVVSPTEVTQAVAEGDTGTAQTLPVTVQNGAHPASAPLNFAFTEAGAPGGATPTLTSLMPSSTPLGVPSFTLRVLGSGFAAGSVIVFNGYDEPTTFVSASEVTTGINMDVWTNPSAPLPVTVRNAEGQMSNALTFTFEAASGDSQSRGGTRARAPQGRRNG